MVQKSHLNIFNFRKLQEKAVKSKKKIALMLLLWFLSSRILLQYIPAIPKPLHPAANINVVTAAVGSLIKDKQQRNNASPPKPAMKLFLNI